MYACTFSFKVVFVFFRCCVDSLLWFIVPPVTRPDGDSAGHQLLLTPVPPRVLRPTDQRGPRHALVRSLREGREAEPSRGGILPVPQGEERVSLPAQRDTYPKDIRELSVRDKAVSHAIVKGPPLYEPPRASSCLREWAAPSDQGECNLLCCGQRGQRVGF